MRMPCIYLCIPIDIFLLNIFIHFNKYKKNEYIYIYHLADKSNLSGTVAWIWCWTGIFIPPSLYIIRHEYFYVRNSNIQNEYICVRVYMFYSMSTFI